MNYHCIAHQNDRRFFHKTMTVQKLLVEENKKCAVDTARHRYEDNVKNGSKGSEVAEK